MKLRYQVPMAHYCSYGIGGPARFFVEPENIHEIREAVLFSKDKKIPYFILGKGSNVLISDRGLNGIVIKIGDRFATLQTSGNKVSAGAGILLNVLINKIAAENLGGFEVLAGIPGSLGGAVVMNAGANRVFIGSFVEGVEAVSPDGDFVYLDNKHLGFSYRHSLLQKTKHILYKIYIHAEVLPQDILLGNIRHAQAKRKKHPVLPSCGSTFRNPPEMAAGRLIEDMGLKGIRCGNAQISPEHGNFIVNLGGARAKDVFYLINLTRKKAAERGIDLKPEVKIWGDF